MQFRKAPSPIEITLSEISIEVKDEQPEKASPPIEATLFPSVAEVKEVQS